ncbi:MAG: hypothetical protein R3C62_16810 [Chloroflexota bacterium]
MHFKNFGEKRPFSPIHSVVGRWSSVVFVLVGQVAGLLGVNGRLAATAPRPRKPLPTATLPSPACNV